MEPKVATGTYINVYYIDRGRCVYDIYVILNEPNDEPSVEEVQAIYDAVTNLLAEKDRKYKYVTTEELELAIGKLGLSCTSLGIQVMGVMPYV